MPLATDDLKTGILTLMSDMRTRTDNVTSDEEFAERFSALMEAFVKSGDGIYQVASLTAGTSTVVSHGSPAIKIE
jgi:hypothetical protein